MIQNTVVMLTHLYHLQPGLGGIYRRKIREKRGVFIEAKSVVNSKKARKYWAFEAMPYETYERCIQVNGGEGGIRTRDTL